MIAWLSIWLRSMLGLPRARPPIRERIEYALMHSVACLPDLNKTGGRALVNAYRCPDCFRLLLDGILAQL